MAEVCVNLTDNPAEGLGCDVVVFLDAMNGTKRKRIVILSRFS